MSTLVPKLAQGHFDKRRGTRAQAREYCMKPESRIDGPYECGLWSEAAAGKRTDLIDACDLIKAGASLSEVASAFPTAYVKYYRGLSALKSEYVGPRTDPPEVYVAYGPPGCGKSRLARSGSDSSDIWVDPIGSGSWFDGYNGQETAIFDDFDGNKSHYRLKDWLKVTDRYLFRVPVKGGFVYWNPKVIWVTTNYHPREWWDWSSREAQYPALQRRVTRVYHWRRDSSEAIVIDRDGRPELWEQWWRGPAPAQAAVLGPLDLYVEHMDPADDFDFIQPGDE